MKHPAAGLALAIGLALGRPAWAGDTLEAILLGSNEVPGPGMTEGSVRAVVEVDGTKISLTLMPKGLDGWMAAHIHRGAPGVDGKLVVGFPWSLTGAGFSSTAFASASPKLAADLVANPQKYYVHVHTPGFPAGAARGQLAARSNADPAPAAETAPAVGSGGQRGLNACAPSFPDGDADQSIRFRELRPRVYRDPDFSLEASASSGLPVSFTATGDCSVSGSTVRIVSAGKCWVTAHQPGNIRFNAAPDVEQRFTIEKAGQRIDGAAPAFKTWLDPDFPLNISASSGLPVVFVASGDCEVNGPYVHLLGAGSCSLSVHQPGDSNFTAAPIVDQQFTIAKADQTISFGEFLSPYYGTGGLPLYASASSGLSVSFSAVGMCAALGSALHILGAGNCTVTAEQPGDRNFNPAPPVTQSFEIVGP